MRNHAKILFQAVWYVVFAAAILFAAQAPENHTCGLSSPAVNISHKPLRPENPIFCKGNVWIDRFFYATGRLICDSSRGVRYLEHYVGFAGDRCALPPDGWVIRVQRSGTRCAGSVLQRIRCFSCGGRPFQSPRRINRPRHRGLSGRTGHAGRIVAGRSSASGMSGRRGLGGAQGPATGISRPPGPIPINNRFEQQVFIFRLMYVS